MRGARARQLGIAFNVEFGALELELEPFLCAHQCSPLTKSDVAVELS
jgi:hypothetical protein